MINFVHKAYANVDIQGNFTLGEGGPALSGKNLASYISPLIQNTFILAGILLLLLLIFGGVTYIMNAGSGDKEGIEKAKGALTTAILGFIIIFIAYWIVQIAGFITGTEIFNSPF